MRTACPFGNKCFYKHQLPDGSIDPGESPHVRRRPRLNEFIFPDEEDDEDEEGGEFSMEDVMNIIREMQFPLMYDVDFDAEKLVAECVDSIRVVTDAPIENCHCALWAVMQILGPHLRSENFSSLEKSAENYQVNVETCHDRVALEQSASTLFDIFLEKQELSYSADQDDETICAALDGFCDIVNKTDPRIPMAVISKNNWEWMSQMLIVLQTDQNDSVREHLLSTLQVLMEKCGEPVKRTLVDTQLPISLVPLTQKSNGIQVGALRVLAILYSTEAEIPLEQLDYLNIDYFQRLYHHMTDYQKTDVLEMCTNFCGLLQRQNLDLSAVFEPIRENPYECANLGIVLIQEMNRKCTVRRLQFLHHVIELGETVLSKLFYENDLKVLAHVLARESINHSDKEIRQLCLTSLRLLLATKTVNSDDDIEYALANFDEN
uniref:C3H1-type domain-containing protein n=2 Tax=Caenorhabditis japonica TaxID=281687 RepID=A0A8R1HNM4_CAEJA